MRRDIAIIIAAALALMAPSLIWGPIAIDSAILNYVWTHEFAQALGRGEFYPRWLAGSFEGLGAPTFYFYPPLAYYLAGAFDLAGLTTEQAINASATVALAASGLTLYGWLRWRGGPALAGALLYMAAPYHLYDVYCRAALAEFAGFIWLPLIVWGLEAWPRRWAPPLLAVSFAGLCLTHLPLALLTSLGLIVPLVIWKTNGGRDVRRLLGYGLAGLAGAVLAGIYLVPALTLQPFISAQVLRTAFYQPDSWSLFAVHGAVTPAVISWPAPIAAASLLLAGGSAWTAWRAGRKEAAAWAGISAFSAVMGLALIPFVWRLPILEAVQFPWRMFAVMEFAAVAAAVTAGGRPGLIARAGAIAAFAVWARIAVLFVQTLTTYALPPDIAQRLPDAPEYLPAGFPTEGIDQDHREPDLERLRGPLATGPVTAASEGPHGRVELLVTLPGQVVIRRFDFPAWRVTRGGVPVATEAAGEDRLIAFAATPGRYRLERITLPAEQQGLWLSLAGLLLTLTSPFAAPSSRKFIK